MKFCEFNRMITFVNFNHYLFTDVIDRIEIEKKSSRDNIKTKEEVFNKFNNSIEEFVKDFNIIIKKNLNRKLNMLNILIDKIYDESVTLLNIKKILYPLKDKCPICLEDELKIVLDCGHVCCEKCSSRITTCFVCKTNIKQKIKMFIL